MNATNAVVSATCTVKRCRMLQELSKEKKKTKEKQSRYVTQESIREIYINFIAQKTEREREGERYNLPNSVTR